MRACWQSDVLGGGLPAPRPDLGQWEERPLWRPPSFGPWRNLGPGPHACPEEAGGSASEGKMKILEKLDEGVSNTNVGLLFGIDGSTVLMTEKNKRAIWAGVENGLGPSAPRLP